MKQTRLFFTLLILISSLRLFAQQSEIIYRDFEPDTCKYVTWSVYGEGIDSLKIDLDFDGTIDFWVSGYIQHGALLPTAYVSDGWWLCYPEENTILDNDSIAWKNYSFWPDGCFNGRYGFKKQHKGNYYYGWMIAFCDMKPAKSHIEDIGRNIYIDKFAFCTIPNYPLHWGQTSLTGIEGNEATAFATLHPNPTTTGLVTIVGKDLNQAEVVNMLGQCVTTVQGKGETLQIDISKLPAGIYFVRITDDEGRKCTHKVVKE